MLRKFSGSTRQLDSGSISVRSATAPILIPAGARRRIFLGIVSPSTRAEMIARRFERLAKQVSFRCQICGGGVLMKTETPVCGWCGAQYQVEEADTLAPRMLLFGAIAAGWAWVFTQLSKAGLAPIIIGGEKKRATTKAAVPMGVSPVLIAILTAGATHISYEWVKKKVGLE